MDDGQRIAYVGVPDQQQRDVRGGAPSLERCTRCGIRLLSNEHTRDRGVCHSCWASEMAEQAAGQEAVPEELAPWPSSLTSLLEILLDHEVRTLAYPR